MTDSRKMITRDIEELSKDVLDVLFEEIKSSGASSTYVDALTSVAALLVEAKQKLNPY